MRLRYPSAVLAGCLAVGLSSVGVFAAPAEMLDPELTDLTGGQVWMLTDSSRSTRRTFSGETRLELLCHRPLSALYLIWDRPPARWSLEGPNGPIERPGESYSYLHEYVPLNGPAGNYRLTWEEDAVLCDIYPLGDGPLPDGVQYWQPPSEKADLLLMPTHADDEHLYFGGIMPHYANDGRYEIQVAYMVHHNTELYRPHELLDGLWTAGVRRYPVIGTFPDIFSESLEHAKTIYNEQDLLDYQVELIRRFRPQVIVGHDLNGEYGHGAHMLNAHTLLKAVDEAAAGPSDNAWDTPKLYLHLYPEGAITLNYDTPLALFEGKTAFEVAVEGFSEHVSQQTYFRVEQKGPYDCRRFGLARTTVGSDVAGDDLFEHLIPYSEQTAEPPPPDIPDASPVPPPVPVTQAEEAPSVGLSPPPAGSFWRWSAWQLAVTLGLALLFVAVFVVSVFRWGEKRARKRNNR